MTAEDAGSTMCISLAGTVLLLNVQYICVLIEEPCMMGSRSSCAFFPALQGIN
jgi:hypothetical protein